MKQDNIVRQKSTDFAVNVVNVVKVIIKQTPYAEHPMCSQLLKSATSIGANVREAEHAESTEDFIHKLKIALKEANETEYWLELFYKTYYLSSDQYESLNKNCEELNRLLIAIIKKTKENNNINN